MANASLLPQKWDKAEGGSYARLFSQCRPSTLDAYIYRNTSNMLYCSARSLERSKIVVLVLREHIYRNRKRKT